MAQHPPHRLARWIDAEYANSEYILAGSLGPGLTLNELTQLSTHPAETAKALNLHDTKLAGATGPVGTLALRQQIASLYNQNLAQITPENILTTNATTGANLLIFQSLLSPGDHVITTYPVYASLLEQPTHFGAKVSHWHLDPAKAWSASLSSLEELLTPKTKLLILNNPHNPTGTLLSTAQQHSILTLAANYNTVVHSDEIFRPLFHSNSEIPTSIIEHPHYPRTIATGSVSKSWCFSGLRIGWCATRDPEIYALLRHVRGWTLEATSMLDETVAAEVLSPRCRGPINRRVLSFAKANKEALRTFISMHEGSVQCDIPDGGATAFVRFSDPKTGKAVDDVAFCRELKREKGVLLAPGGWCFGTLKQGDFRGYVRMHLTCLPEIFAKGLERVGEFIQTEQYGKLAATKENGVNGTE